MKECRQAIKMGAWLMSFMTIISVLLPLIATLEHQQVAASRKNVTLDSKSTGANKRTTRDINLVTSESVQMPTKILMGDSVGLETAIESHHDMMPAAGEHKKYVLVKKKPKHKKIKMEIYKPKMKYKKIKMKVPVKKMKKKKVKGYLVKKEKHGHY